MIKKNQIFLVIGFGPQIIEIINFCKKHNITLNIISGTRQKNSNEIEKNLYNEIKNIKFKKIEFLSKLNDSMIYKDIINQNIDYIISIGSPFIFNKKILSLYKNKIINSHGSPLPEYKGGGGLTWRYLNSDTRGVILYHYIDSKIDNGPIIYIHKFLFPKNKKIYDWINIQIKEEKKGIKKILKSIYLGNKFKIKKHPKSMSSYFPRINTRLQGYINFNWHGYFINRFINGFSFPYEGSSSFINNYKVNIFKSSFVIKKRQLNHPFVNGIIFNINKNFIFVFVEGGYLKLERSYIISKYKVKLGDRFHTPYFYLDRAFKSRIFYDAKGLN